MYVYFKIVHHVLVPAFPFWLKNKELLELFPLQVKYKPVFCNHQQVESTETVLSVESVAFCEEEMLCDLRESCFTYHMPTF